MPWRYSRASDSFSFQPVLQRPGLASRWLEHVLVGPERTHMQRSVRVGADRKWPVLARAEEISWRAGRLPPCCLASGESLVRQPHAAFSIAQFVALYALTGA